MLIEKHDYQMFLNKTYLLTNNGPAYNRFKYPLMVIRYGIKHSLYYPHLKAWVIDILLAIPIYLVYRTQNQSNA